MLSREGNWDLAYKAVALMASKKRSFVVLRLFPVIFDGALPSMSSWRKLEDVGFNDNVTEVHHIHILPFSDSSSG